MDSKELIVRIAWVIIAGLFGIERWRAAQRARLSGITRRRKSLGKKYSWNPDERGIDIDRQSEPVQFYFLTALWYALSVVLLVGALLALASIFYPELFPLRKFRR